MSQVKLPTTYPFLTAFIYVHPGLLLVLIVPLPMIPASPHCSITYNPINWFILLVDKDSR